MEEWFDNKGLIEWLMELEAELRFSEEFPWTWENQPEELKNIYRNMVFIDSLGDPDEGGVIYVSDGSQGTV